MEDSDAQAIIDERPIEETSAVYSKYSEAELDAMIVEEVSDQIRTDMKIPLSLADSYGIEDLWHEVHDDQ